VVNEDLHNHVLCNLLDVATLDVSTTEHGKRSAWSVRFKADRVRNVSSFRRPLLEEMGREFLT
jgi:hypothetical protein